ncbi:hypothetical protein BCR39DRAFT_546165 [Naematelia encephala]|uniref:Chromatin structure-remodeling complex subunit SFH1 n=1 Tax=Naematelia encephala TaxID=71784 RepID=A0A1Y2AQD1_9TREE|nr:hypothetical protein BCR39DRAFT_546165 [Naematelia encephala]
MYRAYLTGQAPPPAYTRPAQPVKHVYTTPAHPAGPLAYFSPPPSQPTTDPSMSYPPTSQGLYTTYPSRLRTGVTGLIQPETITGGPKEREWLLAELDRELGLARGGSTPPPRRVATMSGRARRVNYAEAEEEESDGEEEDEDDARRGWTGTGSTEQQAAMRAGKLRKKREEMDRGLTWLGDRTPGERVLTRRARMTAHTYRSEEDLEREKDRPEWLVPITIDFDVPSTHPDSMGIKLKDRFLWNLNEPHMTPISFARIFCDDVGIPANQHAQTIADLIQGQLEEAAGCVELDLVDREVGDGDVVWDEVERDDDDEREREVGQVDADCRIIVNLDVQIYTHILRDRIEWDLSSPLPPSLFAKHYCTELGLTGEAIPLVAHAITDELLKHRRDALELELFARSHPTEQAKWDKGSSGIPRVNDRRGAKRLVGVWRDWWERDEFGPILVELSMEEMERREMERTREARRMIRGLTSGKRRR